MGNIRSVESAVAFLGYQPLILDGPEKIPNSERLILPGVGSFHAAMANLEKQSFIEAILDFALVKRRPLLGICLGMQILADIGEEGGESRGLSLVAGRVNRFAERGALKIPHVGFNAVCAIHPSSGLFSGFEKPTDFYFVHSYHFAGVPKDQIAATAEYGQVFVAAVQKDNIMGTQFHPEKSQANGLRLLKNFLEI